MLPDFDATASYALTSGNSDSFRELFFDDQIVTFGLNLEIPLDRRRERNNYRSAQIFVQRARRDLRQAEDDLILEIRNTLRGLRTELAQINIGDETIKANARKVRQARIENLQGLAGNRDIVEAVDELTESRNAQLARYVRYEIARLRFIQRVGLMFVNAEGKITAQEDSSAS